MQGQDTTARLLVQCPDQPGIVASVSNFFYNHGANITALDQHSTDPEGGNFFLRLEFQTPHLDVSADRLAQIFAQRIAEPYKMQWHISYAKEKKRVALMVSAHDHALMELLWGWQQGHLDCDVTQVISNHDVLKGAVENFGVPFHHVPVDPKDKAAAEEKILALLSQGTDLVVLARYMQILSPEFLNHFPLDGIINIHHSFLPAFSGGSPYHKAHERGVKLIGATAHYTTQVLDDGPIIEQDVTIVSHRDSVKQLMKKGGVT